MDKSFDALCLEIDELMSSQECQSEKASVEIHSSAKLMQGKGEAMCICASFFDFVCFKNEENKVAMGNCTINAAFHKVSAFETTEICTGLIVLDAEDFLSAFSFSTRCCTQKFIESGNLMWRSREKGYAGHCTTIHKEITWQEELHMHQESEQHFFQSQNEILRHRAHEQKIQQLFLNTAICFPPKSKWGSNQGWLGFVSRV